MEEENLQQASIPADGQPLPEGDGGVDQAQKLLDILNSPEEEGAAPAAPTPTETPKEGGRGYIADIGAGIAQGAMKAVNATYDAAQQADQWLNDKAVDVVRKVGGEEAAKTAESWLSWVPSADWIFGKDELVPNKYIPETETLPGDLTSGFAQLGVGLIGVGKLVKLKQAATIGGSIVQGAFKGAIADFTVFDGNDERLSNLAVKYDWFNNGLTQYLAADEDDGEFEGRFKNVLEGAGIGGAIDAVMTSAKVARARMKGWLGKGDGPVGQTVEEVLDDLDTQADAARAQPEAPVQAPKEPAQGDLFGNAPTTPKAPEMPASEAPTALQAKPQFEADETGQLDMGLGEKSVEQAVKETNPPSVAPAAKPISRLVNLDDPTFNKILEERDWQGGLLGDDKIHGLNLDNITNADELAVELRTVASVYEDKMVKAMGGDANGVRSWEATKANADRLADILGDDPFMLMQRLRMTQIRSTQLDAEMLVYRDFLNTAASKVHELSELVANPSVLPPKYPNREALLVDFKKHYEMLAEIQLNMKGIQTNVARSMNAMKISSKIRDGFKDITPDDLWASPESIEKLARRVASTGGDPKAIVRGAQGAKFGLPGRVVGEFFINNILASPKTLVVNTVSSLGNAAWMTNERILAGALRYGTESGRQEFREGLLQYRALGAAFQDAWRLAGNAFRDERAILDPSGMGVEDAKAITAAAFNMDKDSVGAGIVNAIGVAVRVPTRLMATSDEFVKQTVFRSHVRARAMREAQDQGLRGADFDNFIQARLDNSVTSDGMANTKEAHYEQALEAARKATFSNSLKPSSTVGGLRSFGEIAQETAASHPALRIILPFVRTPTNIMRWFWDRSPILNMVRKENWDDMLGKNGERAQGAFRARQVTGIAIWGTAIMAAMNGMITGGGPTDPEQRKNLEMTGWKPYHLFVPMPDGSTKAIDFRRLDPFATFLGLVGDFADIAGQANDQERDTMAAMAITSMAKQLQNKTYLQGITNFMKFLSDPVKNHKQWVGTTLSSFVPYSGLSRDLAVAADDGTAKEMRTYLDYVRSRIPGFSDNMDVQRNILGEKVLAPRGFGSEWMSPFLSGVNDFFQPIKEGGRIKAGQDIPNSEEWRNTVQQDWRQELIRQGTINGKEFFNAPSTIGNVDLLDEAYRVSPNQTAMGRYEELIGTVKRGGKTLAQALEAKIKGYNYQNRMGDGDHEGSADYEGSRVLQLQKIFGKYREQAKRQLFKELPALGAAVEMDRKLANQAKKPEQQAADLLKLLED